MQAIKAVSSLAAALITVMLAGPGAAEQANQSYSVYVGGLRAGTINLATDVNNDSYAARGVVKADGLLALFSDFGFDGTVRGALSGKWNARPRSYQGAHKNRSGARNTVMAFSGNRPVSIEMTPKREKRSYDIDPLAQSGTVDPITASFMLLRDRPAEAACSQKIEIFDGVKRSRISLGKRQKTDTGWACGGTYERLAGFSQREMEKKRQFDFLLFFTEKDGLAMVEKFQTESIAGKVVAVRR